MKYLILLLTLTASLANASMKKEITIEGVVSSFDNQTVKIFRKGRIVNVPRSAIMPNYKIQTGERVVAVIKP